MSFVTASKCFRRLERLNEVQTVRFVARCTSVPLVSFNVLSALEWQLNVLYELS